MKTNLSIIVLFLALIVTFNCFYVVDMTEHVLITYFGKPVRVVSEPGLKVKGPFLWKVNRLEKRTLEWDGYASQIPTRDKKYIWIDTYARWRVVDPLEFFQAVRNERAAQSRLDDIIDGATRDLISQYDLIELVRNSNREMAADESGTPVTVTPIELGRDQIATKIRQRAALLMPEFGIELVDMQIKRINYVEEVRLKVYERMISERRLIAELLRSEGRRNLEEIEGTREKELNRIRSEAYETAQGIRGQADSLATRIYADAMGQDPEFYSFVKTLESYAASLKGSSTLILSTDSAYLSYLKDLEPRP
jgi:membrane protease subunit HflC